MPARRTAVVFAVACWCLLGDRVVFAGSVRRLFEPTDIEFEKPGVMDLITVDEVIDRFEACAAHLGLS